MDFLKDLFGTPKGPQVLPGAVAPPSKGSDIANVLSRVLGAAGSGLSVAQGGPAQAPSPMINKHGYQVGLGRPAGYMGGMGGGIADDTHPTISALLKRIFMPTNSVAPAQPPSNQIPTNATQIGTGTGGLY